MLAGFGTFLVIFLHKPLDSMTISMLMQRGGWSTSWRNAINGLFALAIPIGVAFFYIYAHWATSASFATGDVLPPQVLALGLAVATGMFLCISLSDLLPELKFHQHDRVKLSFALLAGLAVAYAAGQLEAAMGDPHHHDLPTSDAATQAGESVKQTAEP
jgi:zinc and cadmium transporter